MGAVVDPTSHRTGWFLLRRGITVLREERIFFQRNMREFVDGDMPEDSGWLPKESEELLIRPTSTIPALQSGIFLDFLIAFD